MNRWTTGKRAYLLVALLGAVFFIPFLGHANLFDWDEINFAESAREMLLTGNYTSVQINFHPFWEKPPLFIWMQAASMALFGVNEFAARLPNALCGITTLLVLFYTGKRFAGEAFGWWWVLVYVGSFLPHLYFKSGIIDPVFNLFIFLGLMQLMECNTSINDRLSYRHAILGGLFIGLAILTKGPVGLLLPLLSVLVMMVWQRKLWLLRPIEWLIFLLMVFLVSSLWYVFAVAKDGIWFLHEFFAYQIRLLTTGDSGHGGPIYYHWLVLLLGCFPASVLAVDLFNKQQGRGKPTDATSQWMLVLLGVVLIVFSLVKTKIVHYSSLAYLPLTFFATLAIYRSHLQQIKIKKLIILVINFTVLLLGIGMFSAACLQHLMSGMKPWSWWLVLPGIGFIIMGVALWLLSIYGSQQRWLILLFLGNALLLEITLVMFANPVADISQNAAVNFFKSHANEDAYVQVLGYKSYAHLFYGNKQLTTTQSPLLLNHMQQRLGKTKVLGTEFDEIERDWQQYGTIDKPAYFCCRLRDADKLDKSNGMVELGREGGYAFFIRKPVR